MPGKDQRTRIAQRAYELWEKAGRPIGKDLEHWAQAEAELSRQAERPRAAKGPIKSSSGARRASKVTSIVRERRSTRKK